MVIKRTGLERYMAQTETKLELLKQIREQQNYNRMTMCSRENILYGRPTNVHTTRPNTFLIRVFMTIFLIAGCYQATLSSGKITEYLQEWLLKEDICIDESSLTGLFTTGKMDTE